MTEAPQQLPDATRIVAYDPRWPPLYAAERDLLFSVTGGAFLASRHIGSTAVPGQRAKPITDMMAADPLQDDALLASLAARGYEFTGTGMRHRLFLHRREPGSAQVYHLAEFPTWAERNERLMRDQLLRHPGAVEAYGTLKDALSNSCADDMPGYTRAKTAFIELIDRERDARGLPRVEVWED